MDWFLYDNSLRHEMVKSTCLNKKSETYLDPSRTSIMEHLAKLVSDWVLNKPLKMETMWLVEEEILA